MKSPDVLVVIPQKGRQQLTETLVGQIRQFEDAPILVVDDESPPGTADLEAFRSYSGVHAVKGKGLGVTSAWNIGLRQANWRPVLLLNNDVACRGPFLDGLVTAAGEKGMSGVASRIDKDAKALVLEGWCMCIGPLLAATQWFDESMKLYFSDTDYQLRAKIVPRVVSVPLTHIGHATCHDPEILDQADRKFVWMHDRNRFRRRWCANRLVPN